MQSTHAIIHVRVAGRSTELKPGTLLDVQSNATDMQIKRAVAHYLDLPTSDLADHVIVRTSQAIIIRPEAIYG